MITRIWLGSSPNSRAGWPLARRASWPAGWRASAGAPKPTGRPRRTGPLPGAVGRARPSPLLLQPQLRPPPPLDELPFAILVQGAPDAPQPIGWATGGSWPEPADPPPESV